MNHSRHYSKRMALNATLHCLSGCIIGELIGVTVGTHAGFAAHETFIFAAILLFISGYSVSTIPLLRARVRFTKALQLVFAADTLSIFAMTVADNLMILLIPDAMAKDLSHPVYWLSRVISVTAAFLVAYPVNSYLLKRGKGHALTHEFHS